MTTTTDPTPAPVPASDPALLRRGLFAFHDGYRPRLADIIQIQFRIQEEAPGRDMVQFYDLLDAALDDGTRPAADAAPDQGTTAPPEATSRLTQQAATIRLAALVGIVFDLPALDETTAQGLSTLERMDLLNNFLNAVLDDELGPEPTATEASDATEAEPTAPPADAVAVPA